MKPWRIVLRTLYIFFKFKNKWEINIVCLFAAPRGQTVKGQSSWTVKVTLPWDDPPDGTPTFPPSPLSSAPSPLRLCSCIWPLKIWCVVSVTVFKHVSNIYIYIYTNISFSVYRRTSCLWSCQRARWKWTLTWAQGLAVPYRPIATMTEAGNPSPWPETRNKVYQKLHNNPGDPGVK